NRKVAPYGGLSAGKNENPRNALPDPPYCDDCGESTPAHTGNRGAAFFRRAGGYVRRGGESSVAEMPPPEVRGGRSLLCFWTTRSFTWMVGRPSRIRFQTLPPSFVTYRPNSVPQKSRFGSTWSSAML